MQYLGIPLWHKQLRHLQEEVARTEGRLAAALGGFESARLQESYDEQRNASVSSQTLNRPQESYDEQRSASVSSQTLNRPLKALQDNIPDYSVSKSASSKSTAVEELTVQREHGKSERKQTVSSLPKDNGIEGIHKLRDSEEESRKSSVSKRPMDYSDSTAMQHSDKTSSQDNVSKSGLDEIKSSEMHLKESKSSVRTSSAPADVHEQDVRSTTVRTPNVDSEVQKDSEQRGEGSRRSKSSKSRNRHAESHPAEFDRSLPNAGLSDNAAMLPAIATYARLKRPTKSTAAIVSSDPHIRAISVSETTVGISDHIAINRSEEQKLARNGLSDKAPLVSNEMTVPDEIKNAENDSLRSHDTAEICSVPDLSDHQNELHKSTSLVSSAEEKNPKDIVAEDLKAVKPQAIVGSNSMQNEDSINTAILSAEEVVARGVPDDFFDDD